MANVYGALKTNFKPFTFEEMLKPALMATEAHLEQEEELNTLLEDAAIKAFNFMPQDTQEKEVYNAIMDRIKDAAGSLSYEGISPALRNDILKLNREYRSYLLPIQQQINKRAELIKEQRELLAKNPNLEFDIDYSNAKLKDVTSASTFTPIDIKAYEEEIAKEFGDITSNVVHDAQTTTKLKGTNTYNVIKRIGYTQEEFEEAFSGGENGGPQKDHPVYMYYKEKADEIERRTNIDRDIKDKLKRSLYTTMKANAGKQAMDTTPGRTYSGGAKTPTQIFSHFDSEKPEEIKNAYYTLGTKLIRYEVLGLEKNTDGSYKTDKQGNYIPILGNEIKTSTKKVVHKNTIRTVNDQGVTGTETTYTYDDGSTYSEFTADNGSGGTSSSNAGVTVQDMYNYGNND